MKTIRKFLSIMLVLLMVFMTGCSSNDKNTEDSSKDTGNNTGNNVSSDNNSATDSDEEIYLKVLITSLNDSADGPYLEGVIQEYMDLNPNVTIEPIAVAMNDLYTTLLTRATSDDLPDIFTMQEAYMANAVEMDMVADLNDLMGEEWLNGTLPVALKGATVDDTLVFMPWQNNIMAVVYRKDLFEEKNLSIPETWDEFVEVAQALTEDLDGDGTIDRYGFVAPGTRNDSAASRFNAMLMTFGADTVREENGTFVTDIGTDKFEEAMKFFIDCATTYGITPPGFVETGYPEASQMIAADQAAMIISASNVMGAVLSNNPDMDGKLGSFPLPHSNDTEYRTVFGTLGMSISSTSEHPEVAADFLKFLTNDKNSLEWNAVSKRLPCQISALDLIISENPEYSGFAESSDFADLLPAYAGTAELRDIMGECWQAVIAEGISLEDALDNAAKKAQAVLEKY